MRYAFLILLLAACAADDPAERLTGLVADAYRVDYATVSFPDGERSDMVQYVLGERMRTDMEIDGVRMQIYYDGRNAHMCMEESDGWRCIPAAAGLFDRGTIELVEKDPSRFDIHDLPSRTIAGTRASCFGIVDAYSDVEYCLSEDGIPLLIRTRTDEGTVEMLAQRFARDVSESLFALPE